jgi:hypothetical protein
VSMHAASAELEYTKVSYFEKAMLKEKCNICFSFHSASGFPGGKLRSDNVHWEQHRFSVNSNGMPSSLLDAGRVHVMKETDFIAL